MKRQRVIVLLVATMLVICTAVVWAQAAKYEPGIKSPTSDSSGRFQLFQGQYIVNTAGTPYKDFGVFKIDTETGRVWLYQDGQTKSGQTYRKWEAVEN